MPEATSFTFSADIVALSRFAEVVAGALRPGDVVLLIGDLGAGKTTFTKLVASALGVTDEVTSPTFTIAHTYDTGPGASVRSLAHLDAYRLRSADDLDAVGLFDNLDDGAAAMIEWGDIVADAFDAVLRVELSFVDDTTRSVVCCAPAEGAWAERMAAPANEFGVQQC